jgi:hypothetical protein
LRNIVGSFKSAITKWAYKNGCDKFKGQRNYYDRIIRSDKELFQTRKYIQYNTLNWEIEKTTPKNINL